MDQIKHPEPMRYTTRERHFFNNGFRRRWLSIGARNAEVINAARRDDVETVVAFLKTKATMRGYLSAARQVIKAAKALDADVKPYTIKRDIDGKSVVFIPEVSSFLKRNSTVWFIQELPMYHTGRAS